MLWVIDFCSFHFLTQIKDASIYIYFPTSKLNLLIMIPCFRSNMFTLFSTPDLIIMSTQKKGLKDAITAQMKLSCEIILGEEEGAGTGLTKERPLGLRCLYET